MVAYLLIIVVAFVVVSTTLISMVGEYLFSQKVREEQRVTGDLAASMYAAMQGRDALLLYQQARDAAGELGGRVLVVDGLGVVQADSHSLLNGQRVALREVTGVLSGGSAVYGYYDLDKSSSPILRSLKQEPRGNALMGVYAAPMRRNAVLLGAVVYFSGAEEVYESLIQMQQRMAVWLVLVALAVLLLSVMVAGIFTRPIGELSLGIQRMTGGDLSSRVTVRGHNEFSQLAQAFNMMCQKLESLDQSRNQFVSNASHELKTPLSAMKILIETLLYQEAYDPAMTKEFLSDVNGEIDRLNSIVGDLLTLVHIDSGRMELRPESLSLDELVQDSARRLRPIAEKRDIRLEVSIRDKIDTTADAQKLSQVFYNLIDNAIKYTPEGGFVKVDMSRSGRMARVEVIDSGIGIPQADQLHVFDRFYRVDKARARATGGTGLGLSIVQQIVLLHRGTITVSSQEDVGSTFTVELPIITLSV